MQEVSQENISHNKSFYDKKYKDINVDGLVDIVNRAEEYLEGSTKTEISWVGMYKNNFKDEIPGKAILELGCGDCKNVAIMAALGAKVYANDISEESGKIVELLNQKVNFQHPITYIHGDFVEAQIERDSLDIVMGKAFLHHLTLEHEEQMIRKIVESLNHNGQARFFEPAVNSKILDELRWAIPVPGRPSKWFQPKAFKRWEEADPHPERSNSSKHFENLGSRYFKEVKTEPMGIMERFYRILPLSKKQSRNFKQWTLRNENMIPKFIRRSGARSQLIVYRKPIKS